LEIYSYQKPKIANVVHQQSILFGAFPLVLALIIYLFFREKTTVLWEFIRFFSLEQFFIQIGFAKNYLPEWFVYSLPGALWMFSFTMFLNTVTVFKKSLITVLPLLAALSIEFSQYFSITDGVFDWQDVFFYLLFYAVATIIAAKVELFTHIQSKATYTGIMLFYSFIVALSDVA